MLISSQRESWLCSFQASDARPLFLQSGRLFNLEMHKAAILAIDLHNVKLLHNEMDSRVGAPTADTSAFVDRGELGVYE